MYTSFFTFVSFPLDFGLNFNLRLISSDVVFLCSSVCCFVTLSVSDNLISNLNHVSTNQFWNFINLSGQVASMYG